MRAYREINRQPPQKELFKLAAVFLGFLGAFGAHQAFVKHNESAAHVLWALAVGLAVLSILPVVGRMVYVAWMALGITIGMVTQPIFLLVTYTLFFVPIGIVFRLISRDTMRRKLGPKETSYWEDYTESSDKGSYFKQY